MLPVTKISDPSYSMDCVNTLVTHVTLWQVKSCFKQLLPQGSITCSDDYWPDEAAGGWTSQPKPQGAHDSFKSTADGAAGSRAGALIDPTTMQP